VEAYSELLGSLASRIREEPPAGGFVVFSELLRGETQSSALPGLMFKYVADGAVDHRFGQRSYSVKAGEWLFVPPGLGSQMAVRPGDGGACLGLCLYLPEAKAPAPGPIEQPLVFSAGCSTLGRILSEETLTFRGGGPGRIDRARRGR
jgi:hypothetical protein